ncbi:MAG: radical SAM protein [Myxococcales bacterium]|nr:radical SAM protein [Myxococcales bacterium]
MLRQLWCSLADRRWSRVQSLEADLHELRYLFWEATRQCNLACRHCGSDCSKDEVNRGLEAAVVLDTLRRIASRYRASDIMLVTTGGEPLVRRDLMDVLGGARALGFQLGLVSNGLLLDAERARALAALGLDSVVVSLDGPEAEHDWLRARAGAFAHASRALAALVAARVPIVEAITCVTPRSLPLLDATYDIVRALGVSHWRVFNIFPRGRAASEPDLLLDAAGVRALVPAMARLRARGASEGLVVNLSEEGWLGWEWESKVRDAPYFCRAGIHIAGILADGGIAACPNLAPWLTQGNVRRDDFVEVWEQRYQAFRDRSWTETGQCAGCKEWKVCRGNSLHLWDAPTAGPSSCHYQMLHPAEKLRRGRA